MAPEAVAGIELPEGEPQAIYDAAAGLGRLAGGFEQVAMSFRRAAAATPSWSGQGAAAAQASMQSCAQAADASREACITAHVEVKRYGHDFEQAYERVKRLQADAAEVEAELEARAPRGRRGRC